MESFSEAGRHGNRGSGGASGSHSVPIDLLGDDDAAVQLRNGQASGRGDDEADDDGNDSRDNPTDIADGPAIPGDVSFKRRQKQAHFLPQSARALLSTFGVHSASSSPYAHDDAGGSTGGLGIVGNDDAFVTQGVVGGRGNLGSDNTNVNFADSSGKAGAGIPSVVDWYAEGLGRRVGYEDLTAIDWIFEYNKERQRQRALLASSGGGGGGGGSGGNALVFWGYMRRLFDAGQVWVVLVLTGLAAGALAAAIDVVSDWLGDLKSGYCASGGPDGGAFYLNHGFCCIGYDEGALCEGWRPWAAALGITSTGVGKWFIEYLFFVILSVTFAICAAMLVKEYAVYAKMSGIPEIKTMLGGFVIRRFLGAWTLVTKSLGLVCSLSLPSSAPRSLSSPADPSVPCCRLWHVAG